MLSHSMLGTNDLERAVAFYDQVLELFGATRVFATPRLVAWGTKGPEFIVGLPHDGQPATVGNGTMVALSAPTRAMVGEVHAKALAAGGADEGAPGVRGADENGFYGAYFRDIDGHKVCVYRFGPAD